MKTFFLMLCFLSIVFHSALQAQSKCQDFETIPLSQNPVSSIGNWRMYNSSGVASSPANIRIAPGRGGRVITASDANGSTHLVNTQDFDGNWVANGDNCFCFYLKLISDGSANQVLPPVKHGIQIFQNLNTNAVFSTTNPGIRFVFTLTTAYDETTPWQRICLPIKTINPGDPLPSNQYGQWTWNPASNNGGFPTADLAWNAIITNVTEVAFFVDVTSANQSEVIGLDSLCLGCEQTSNICCPELKNLIANFDFSNSNPPLGFNSQYVYDAGLPANGSLLPGEFGITNKAGAAAICPNWPAVQDHSTCPTNGNGNFMVVNGRTGQTTPPKRLVWEQTLNNLPGGREYKFCAHFKNLPQCCFDVKPKIDITFGVPGSDLLNQVINVNSSANCGWIELNKVVALPPGSGNITIQIWLDESTAGDGNDLAIDDIAFFYVPPVGTNVAAFSVSLPTPLGGNLYSYTFGAAPLQPGCYCAWAVCELDPVTDQCKTGAEVYNFNGWWSLPNYCTSFNFAGYNGIGPPIGNLSLPGQFDITKTYRITRGVWCDCKGWSSISYDLNERNGSIIVSDSKTKQIVQKLALSKTK